jgi:hypothetical protein
MRTSLSKLLRPCFSHSTWATQCARYAIAPCTTLANTAPPASDSNSYAAHLGLATLGLSGAWALTTGTAPAAAAADAAAPQFAADGHIEADGITAGGKLLSLSMRQRIFFKYEKRIRELSSLEKVFDYFSTHDRCACCLGFRPRHYTLPCRVLLNHKVTALNCDPNGAQGF